MDIGRAGPSLSNQLEADAYSVSACEYLGELVPFPYFLRIQIESSVLRLHFLLSESKPLTQVQFIV